MSNIIKETMKMVAINFAEFIHKNHYTKYWGNDEPNCNKWYVYGTMPTRKYYTTDELYELFFESERQRLETGKEPANQSETAKCDCGRTMHVKSYCSVCDNDA